VQILPRYHRIYIDADLADTFELKIQINRVDPEEACTVLYGNY